MIRALMLRRIWVWKNQLVPNIFLFFTLPVSVFYFVSLPLKNIMRFSLSDVPYDIWVFPGLIFIIGSFSIYPSIYRDYFDLRINNKVLINISLSPYSKKRIIFSTLVSSLSESFVMISISILIYFTLTSIPYSLVTFLFLGICLSTYLFILGNLLIFLSVTIDTLSVMLLGLITIFILVLFGSGFLFELSFYPIVLESILSWSPFAISFQVFQKFHSTGIIAWKSLFGLTILIYLFVTFNGYQLKRKLKQ